MVIQKKIKKLFLSPNRFFFDYFSKRIGSEISGNDVSLSNYILPAGYSYDEKIHPWVQVAKKFKLKTGATTGHPDQSLLVDSLILRDFLLFTLWVCHGTRSDLKIYTLGGGFEAMVRGADLLNPKKADWLFSKVCSKPDFVIEFIGEFDNNFASHIFTYDVNSDEIFTVRSSLAFIKKGTLKSFNEIYPSIINKFGDYSFGSPMPVDVVYTWVNKDDSSWLELWNKTYPEQAFDLDRYTSRDELRYSLRALCKFMPWFHKVHIVSNCSPPHWLKSHPRVNWIHHEEIFPDSKVLPTFNSHAIEACLHLIPELSEHFIYFNDDMLINKPCYYSDFFDQSGRSISYLESHGAVFNDNFFDCTRDYLSPAISSQQLIKQKFPGYIATNLHKHTPYALKKEILKEISDIFNLEISKTRSNRLRSPSDVNLPSFLYHHYALASGKAVYRDCQSVILRPSNIKKVLNTNIRIYRFICFNDGDGSSMVKHFSNEFNKFVNKNYPKRGPFEIENQSFSSQSISVTIMAHKNRAYRIPYLRSMLGDALASIDDGSLGIYKNSKQSWLMHDFRSEFHLVIQDDAVVCRNFYDQLSGVLKKATYMKSIDTVFCLYFRLKKDLQKKVFVDFNEKAINGAKEGFFIDKNLRYGLALMVPTVLIKKMIFEADKLEHLGNHDDTRYSTFFSKNDIKVFYPLPSIVDQAPEISSIKSNYSNKNQVATWFIDGQNGFKKNIVEDLPASLKNEKNIDEINLYWWDKKPNFGDQIGPYIVSRITGKKVTNINRDVTKKGLLSVGSILQHIDRPGMTIWGSGIIRPYGYVESQRLSTFIPNKIYALRGKETFNFVTRNLGWSAPEIFGDPALLMPHFFNPARKQGGIVICPHYAHYEQFKLFSNDFLVVDVREDVEAVVEAIAGANTVLSTSLHGLIIAQAYGVPWVWLRSKDTLIKGGDFKFEDFFSTINRDKVSIFDFSLNNLTDLDIKNISEKSSLPELQIDLNKLLDNFPHEIFE